MNRAAPLRVLIVEHDEADAELVLLELRRAGFVVDGTIVGTPEQFAATLHERPFDIVLSDYRLPSWTGMDALVQLRALGFDTPLILVTGTLGDERAVECVKRGAADYIIKDNLARLPLAVTRALDERLAITDRLTAQRALMESEARYRTLTEASFDAIAISQNGIILEVNGGFAAIFGYSPGEIIGRPILDYCAPESVDEVRARVLAGAEGTYEMVGQRKDGRKLLLESTAKATAINGQPARITALRDLTGRRQLEEQFRQAQKMEAVGRLAGGVAHDFNNLLTIITGYATLVCDDLDRDHPGRQGVEQIQKAANDAAALTRQLLLFSRQQVIVPRITALDTVVQQSKKMLQRLIGEDITLVTSHGVIRPTTLIDPGEVEQVIMNLVVNSRDAMPTGGTVTIRTGVVDLAEADVRDILLGTPGRFVVLAVGDTGTGMDVDTRARIFEPFFTTKPEGTGTGLGLATVYGVVKARGGSIHVDSEVGRGTTFTIYLPYGTDELEGDDPAAASQAGAIGNETILLAEDAAPVRGLIRQALERLGYRILEASTGEMAVSLAASGETIDLLLTDVVMPGMSGRVLAERFEVLRPGTRVLYMSGYTDDAVVRHGISTSAVAYLQKPFTPEMLGRRVREVLDAL